MSDPNDLTENKVVEFTAAWLETNGFKLTQKPKINTQAGDDISAISKNGVHLFVECKGSVSKLNNQLKDWDSAAMAIFGAIKDTEEKRPSDRHAIAIPNTEPYRKTIGQLNSFFAKQRISVLWVDKDGLVTPTGAPLPET